MKVIKQTFKSQIRKCWGFPQKSSALFSLKIHFNKKWKAFWLQTGIFGWEVLGLQHFQFFLFSFFFLTENRHLLPHWKVNPFFRQSHSPFLILVETIPMRFFLYFPGAHSCFSQVSSLAGQQFPSPVCPSLLSPGPSLSLTAPSPAQKPGWVAPAGGKPRSHSVPVSPGQHPDTRRCSG